MDGMDLDGPSQPGPSGRPPAASQPSSHGGTGAAPAWLPNSSQASAPSTSFAQPHAEPRTPIGSPLKQYSIGRGGTGAGASPWLTSSPKSRVTYSDRFIPSRATNARLDFSVLDREVAAAEVNKSASEREVGMARGCARRVMVGGAGAPGRGAPALLDGRQHLRCTRQLATSVVAAVRTHAFAPLPSSPTATLPPPLPALRT